MKKTIKKSTKMTQTELERRLSYLSDHKTNQKTADYWASFLHYDKLINAGGFNMAGLNILSGNLSLAGDTATLWGEEGNVLKLGEARYSDINPGIDDIIKQYRIKFISTIDRTFN
ncbi:MAG: hypothetical protein V3R52_02650 [Candidatus Neomarinimicrobiota bacterium]